MKEPMKIISLTTNYPESQNPHSAKFVHEINKELVKLGSKVKTITPHIKGARTKDMMDSVSIIRFKYLPENCQFNYSSIINEINKSKIGFLKMIIMTCFFFLRTFLECINEKPSIVHAHWSFPCGYIAYLMSMIFKTKFIITAHGGEIGLLKKFRIIKKMVINALNNSSAVIANSNYTKKELIELGVKNKKISVIRLPPNFAEQKLDDKLLSVFRKKFAEQDKKIILFVGRLIELKGTKFLIKSLPYLKNGNIHLIIAGDGPMLEELKQITSSLNLEDKVTFYGWANPNEVHRLYNISDIFVCPSIVDSKGSTEGLGLVIPEAMDSGLPVIASSVGGIVDTVKNEVNGLLVPQKDSKAIARALERLIEDEELVGKLVENSKATVKEFSCQTITQKYYKIFQESIEK